jgi:5-methylcytosine-specific restriction endonuclease McrA
MKIKQSEKKRPTLEYVKKKFKEGGCELLAKVYKNAHTKMPYICSCGNKSEITYVHFRNSRRCKKCAIKKVAGKQRHTFEYVKKQFADGGCTLIARDYKNAKTKMPYLCSCGNQSEISYNTFKKGGRCRKCGIKKGTRRGEDSSSWNPNLTDKEREGKRVSGNDTWSKNVKKRDSHTCQGCASTKNLHAHHIMSYKNHKELRIDISNGITLCHDCHMDFHRMYSRSGGTPKQLASFLKGEKKIN